MQLVKNDSCDEMHDLGGDGTWGAHGEVQSKVAETTVRSVYCVVTDNDISKGQISQDT